VRIPLSITDGARTVEIGVVEGGPSCARVVLNGWDVAQATGCPSFDAAAVEVEERIVRRIHEDLVVGVVIRKVLAKKPLLAKMLDALLQILASEVDGHDRDALLRFTSPQ
jgi:hypothetical protein